MIKNTSNNYTNNNIQHTLKHKKSQLISIKSLLYVNCTETLLLTSYANTNEYLSTSLYINIKAFSLYHFNVGVVSAFI